MGECVNLRRGGKKKSLPILNANYPADVTVEYGGSATFKIEIAEHGYPEEYTYQWYQDGSPMSGYTESTLHYPLLIIGGTFNIRCDVTNKKGTVQSRTATLIVGSALPNYTFSGSSHWLVDDGNGNWRLFIDTSGTLRFSNRGTDINGIDVFLVGGGAGGRSSFALGFGGGGGGGGYTKTVTKIGIAKDTDYGIVIGGGGGPSANGGETRFVGHGISGGTTGGNKDNWMNSGGNGGSGGGGGANWDGGRTPGNGGSDGGNGGKGNYECGYGQGYSTREFGNGENLYSAGGGGGSCGSLAGANDWQVGYGGNYGGGNGGENATFYGCGGGGGHYRNSTAMAGGYGRAGIVVIRNTR